MRRAGCGAGAPECALMVARGGLCRAKVMEWYDKKEDRLIIFAFDQKGSLEVLFTYPSELKTKAVYFIKPEDMAVTKDNMGKLLRGDLAPQPVEALAALVDGMFLKVLGNQDNTDSWPSAVTQDIFHQAQMLKSSTAVMVGQIKGRTQLPLPAAKGDTETELVHTFESCVIDWTHQVQDLLRHDSAQQLLDGGHPNAMVEMDFWSAKRDNLEYIAEQLEEPEVAKMREVLTEHASSYAAPFEKLVLDVTAALAEAVDITTYLEPLRALVEETEETELALLPKNFLQIMTCVKLVWLNSKEYNTPRHIVVLLREIMNGFVEVLEGQVEPRGFFNLEPLEAKAKLDAVLDVMAQMEVTFAEVRAQLEATTADTAGTELESIRGGPWRFENELVLGRFRRYQARLVEFQALTLVRIDYEKLEKVELSDVTHAGTVKEIFTTFNDQYAAFVKRTAVLMEANVLASFFSRSPWLISPDFSSRCRSGALDHSLIVSKISVVLSLARCSRFDRSATAADTWLQ